jgi:hypothetical protein
VSYRQSNSITRKARWVNLRIVWKGGEVSALSTPIKIRAFKKTSNYDEMKNIIINAHAEKKKDKEIALILNEKNFMTPSLTPITAEVVQRWRLSHRIIRPRGGKDPLKVKGFLTIRNLCKLFKLHRHWIGDRIRSGRIKVLKDKRKNCYIFPNTEETIKQFKLFVSGKLSSLNFTEGY